MLRPTRWFLAGISFIAVALALPAVEPSLPDFRRPAPLASVQQAARAAGIRLEGLTTLAKGEGLQLGDGVTVLVSRTEGKMLQQWVIDLQATPLTEEEAKRPQATAKTYTSSGHEFSFSGGRAALTIRLIGPFEVDDAGREAATIPKVTARRVLVSADYLVLGLERTPAAMLKLAALREQHPEIPQSNLSFGSKPYAPEVVAATNRQPGMRFVALEDEKAFFGSILALEEFLTTINRTPGLQDLLMSVVDVPWWSVLRSMGNIDFHLEAKQGISTFKPPRNGLTADAGVYAWPFRLRINGKPALVFQLAVVAPRPPLVVTAGVVGIVAGQPDGKGPVLELEVVSSRLGRQ